MVLAADGLIRDATEWATAVAGLLGGAVALLGLAAALRGWYRRTPGRRRDRYERLARLGTGAQLSFFISVLGEPPAIRTTIEKKVRKFVPRDEAADDVGETDDAATPPQDEEDLGGEFVVVPEAFTECFFIDRDYYVQTISDADETVLAFSVTTRKGRFAPTFTMLPRPRPIDRIRWRLQVGQPTDPCWR
jgi:hypothetical protein